MNERKIVDVHIFSPGKQTSAQGVEREFTKKDLKQVVDSYKPKVHEAPILIGHEMNDKMPSWGWVEKLKMKGDQLFAEVNFAPQMGDYIRDGLYKKVSASFYSPESKINPDPGKWSLRHVAMLGGQPPAVKGLSGFAYSEESEGEGVLDFAMTLTPDQVFDKELGPTLKSDLSPLESLKEQLEEARQEMAEEQKQKQGAQETLDDLETGNEIETRDDSDFAEKKDMKKKAPAGKQGAEEAEEEVSEEDAETVESKEKKMDPVGEADGDIDNDGDEDSSDEYLKKRRAAIKKSIMSDKSDNKELPEALKKNMKKKEEDAMEADTSDNSEDSVDHKAGCSSAKEYMEKYSEKEHGEMKAYMEKYSDKEEMKEYMQKHGSKYMEKDSSDHSEIEVPEGMDPAQFEAGFKDAVDKFYAATEAGADEVVHEESEDQTADYKAGIEAGFEFAQARMSGFGSAKHNEKCCDTDEESEGQGPEASKVKKQNSGANELDGEETKYGEPTFDPSNDNGAKKKRGSDGKDSSDVGVKETTPFEEADETAHEEFDGQGRDFGRGKVGKAGVTGETNRASTGKAKKSADDAYEGVLADDNGDEEKSRASTGKAPSEDRKKVGKGPDSQDDGNTNYVSTGSPKMGSGKAIKSPSIRVMKVGSNSNFAEFSELTARLEQLEAANAKLVAEKAAAEQHAHRLQLEDFAESLYSTGRLTPAVCDQDELVDYMEGLEYGTLEFAEGESPATKLMELLASLPAQVSFSEVAALSSEEIPLENLDPHERALRLSKEEGLEYTEALKQTLFTAE